MNRDILTAIFKRWQKTNPHPKTELIYRSHFELLIAVMLSAQATDVSVNKATKVLFKVANTPEKMQALQEEGLKPYIKTIGLYNSKAKNIIRTCEILIQKHRSGVPRTRVDLEALPGVGRKTANVILNAAFGEPTLAVDTHIFRLANRIGLAPGKTPLVVEKKLLEVIPETFLQNAHHWLILHGRYVCTARAPHCKDCLIQDLCEYPHKNLETD